MASLVSWNWLRRRPPRVDTVRGRQDLGGGGGGAPGGGEGGGGGFSYVIDAARDPFGITGGNPVVYNGSGYVSINFVGPPVPEPSTWAMMLVGFAGLGYAGYRRARKPRAA